jgi:hypothetical protein
VLVGFRFGCLWQVQRSGESIGVRSIHRGRCRVRLRGFHYHRWGEVEVALRKGWNRGSVRARLARRSLSLETSALIRIRLSASDRGDERLGTALRSSLGAFDVLPSAPRFVRVFHSYGGVFPKEGCDRGRLRSSARFRRLRPDWFACVAPRRSAWSSNLPPHHGARKEVTRTPECSRLLWGRSYARGSFSAKVRLPIARSLGAMSGCVPRSPVPR